MYICSTDVCDEIEIPPHANTTCSKTEHCVRQRFGFALPEAEVAFVSRVTYRYAASLAPD